MPWVVMVRQRWQDFEPRSAWHVLQAAVRVEGPGDGFLPVYDDIEQAQAEWPGADLIEVAAGPKKSKPDEGGTP